MLFRSRGRPASSQTATASLIFEHAFDHAAGLVADPVTLAGWLSDHDQDDLRETLSSICGVEPRAPAGDIPTLDWQGQPVDCAACPHQAFALGPHLALQFHVELDAEKAPASAATAGGTSFVPSGTIEATDVQAAIQELDTAVAASATAAGVSVVPSGNISATNVQAALQEGLTEVPIISRNGLSQAQKTAYRTADNKIGDNSTWPTT